MANVFKRAGKNGTGTWCVRYKDPVSGQDIKKATDAKTKREAEVVLAEITRDIHSGEYHAKKRQSEVRFFEICDDFMVYSQGRKRSWTRDELTIRTLKGFFGDCLAKEVTPAAIEKYVLQRQQKKNRIGRPLAPATINKELAALKTIFNRAVRDGKADSNPMRHIKLLKENNKRERVLSDDEFKRLLEAAPKHLRPILITAIETGMRRGEIFSLQWDQVDLKKGFITLLAENTKTNEGRRIPISPALHKTLIGLHPKSGLIFPYHGSEILSVKRSFLESCAKAKIEDFRFHDFRHTFVTNMRRKGVQDRVIMAITGHKTMSMLMRYDTVGLDDLKAAVGVRMEQKENPGTFLEHLGSGADAHVH
jgi:integrase